MREKFNGNFFQSQNSSKFYISSRYKISIYPTRSIVEIRNQNYEIHALLSLQLDHRMSKRNTFPTVYEIGQPWPLVITSHHSGNDIFERAFRNLLQLISRISPLISPPFEVSDPLPRIDITTRENRPPFRSLSASSSLHGWGKVRGTNARFRNLARRNYYRYIRMQLLSARICSAGIRNSSVPCRDAVLSVNIRLQVIADIALI